MKALTAQIETSRNQDDNEEMKRQISSYEQELGDTRVSTPDL